MMLKIHKKFQDLAGSDRFFSRSIEHERTKKQQKQTKTQAYVDDRISKTLESSNSIVKKKDQQKRLQNLNNSSSWTNRDSDKNSNDGTIRKRRKISFQPFAKFSGEDQKSVTQVSSALLTTHRKKSALKQSTVKTTKELKLAYSEYYLSLTLLQNYQEMNFTGFRKILKKHDKVTDTEFGCFFRTERVEKSAFVINTQVPQLILQVESIMTELEGNDRSKAMKRLRVPPLEKSKDYPIWVVYRVGLFTGILILSLCLLAWKSYIILTISDNESKKLENLNFVDSEPMDSETALENYFQLTHAYRLLRFFWITRPLFYTWIFIIFLGINIYAFKCAGVNHVLIFEIDPRNHLGHLHFLEIGTFLGIVWSGIININCNRQLDEIYSEYTDNSGFADMQGNSYFHLKILDYLYKYSNYLPLVWYITIFLFMIKDFFDQKTERNGRETKIKHESEMKDLNEGKTRDD